MCLLKLEGSQIDNTQYFEDENTRMPMVRNNLAFLRSVALEFAFIPLPLLEVFQYFPLK